MDCTTCKENREPATIPFVAHESAMARMERVIKKQWITVLVLIILLVGSNCAWLYYESQFMDIEVTQENQDGYNNYIGNDGDIDNGETNN